MLSSKLGKSGRKSGFKRSNVHRQFSTGGKRGEENSVSQSGVKEFQEQPFYPQKNSQAGFGKGSFGEFEMAEGLGNSEKQV